MITAHRTLIRRYVRKLLLGRVDVGDKIFINRPSPRFREHLPCICIHYGSEPARITQGDEYNPNEYEKKLVLNIDILAEEQLRPELDIEHNSDGEDILDSLGYEVELALSWDYTLGKLLEEYNPDDGCGLSRGVRLLSTTPYNIESGQEIEALAQRLSFEVPYLQENIIDTKLDDFLQYKMSIIEPNDGETLIGAEGDVRNG